MFSAADKNRYIYFLVEHQSTNDSKIAWRLRQYKDQIWARFQTEYPKRKLPVIYSAVIYNGKAKYTAPRIFWDLFVEPEEARSVENDEYFLVDLQHMEDNLLKEEKFLFEFFFKHLWDTKNLFHVFSAAAEIYNLMEYEQQKREYLFFQGLVWYTANRIKEKDKGDFIKIIKEIINDQNEDIMRTVADAWRDEWKAEGIEIGKAEGIELAAKNMLKANADVIFVSKVTGLSLSKIEELKQNL
ncbi:Rpn family recombination-promoting nuclease/putative transposase [Rickettsia endosymbiont of Cardiosporidium cionae]|nr:Rpn family recombination-promoting nuclease/putative transposase [Rickettsia endosymbiont of Cardiosporidium cionae]